MYNFLEKKNTFQSISFPTIFPEIAQAVELVYNFAHLSQWNKVNTQTKLNIVRLILHFT